MKAKVGDIYIIDARRVYVIETIHRGGVIIKGTSQTGRVYKQRMGRETLQESGAVLKTREKNPEEFL